MTVLGSLTILFILLTSVVMGKPALYILSGLFMNIILFFIFILLLKNGHSIYGMTMIYILLNSYVTLVYVNGWNEKTKAAFFSMIIFLVIVTIIFVPLTHMLSIQGFSHEEVEELAVFDLSVSLNFVQLTISMLLIGVAGALIDGSMAIASATYEIFDYYAERTRYRQLFLSSMNVVRSILNATINTLFFAFVSSGIGLIFVYQDLGISFGKMINAKMFVTELAIIVLSAISTAWILPFTASISSYYFIALKKD